MKTQTASYLILALIILIAALGFLWLEKTDAREGQATKIIARGYPVATPTKNIIQVQQQSGYTAPQKAVQQPQRTTTTQPAQKTTTPPPSSCGTCRKWAACGFNVDQLMVNGQSSQCIDAYKAASSGIPYCGKTASMQNCDPYGSNRAQCVCR